jgi:hypothetical protein
MTSVCRINEQNLADLFPSFFWWSENHILAHRSGYIGFLKIIEFEKVKCLTLLPTVLRVSMEIKYYQSQKKYNHWPQAQKKKKEKKLTPRSLSSTKLSSIAPIHSRDPINDGSLSPISTSTCWISLVRKVGTATSTNRRYHSSTIRVTSIPTKVLIAT